MPASLPRVFLAPICRSNRFAGPFITSIKTRLRPYRSFRRHLDDARQTSEKSQCLYGNLMSNNSVKRLF